MHNFLNYLIMSTTYQESLLIHAMLQVAHIIELDSRCTALNQCEHQISCIRWWAYAAAVCVRVCVASSSYFRTPQQVHIQ
jgi:hypothetical protein